MNRQEFMNELERLLQDIPANERSEAIQYYNDYFEDAGAENEAEVIRELGSPEQVARTIREGMGENTSEYTEKGYEDARFRDSQEMASPAQDSVRKSQKPAINTNFWKIFCIILLCIILCPIVIPLGAAALAVVAVVIIGIIAAFVGVGAAGFALLIAGVCTIVLGLIRLAAVPSVGVALGGIGCLILAVGILVSLLILWALCKLVPWMIRTLISLIRYPLRKAGIIK